MNECDVAVVGGGPIGGHVASLLAESGHSVSVFEEHKEIGLPLKCAGLVTPRVLDMVNIKQTAVVQNTIKGAHIHSPSNHILTVGGNRKHAFVIDRSEFDKKILHDAHKKGATILSNHKITAAQRQKDFIILATSQDTEYRCKLVVGADGPYSEIRDRFAFPQPKEFLQGIGAQLVDTSLDHDFVELFVGNAIAPDFFAWIIPTNAKGTRARAGLCVAANAPHHPKQYLSTLLQHENASPFLEQATISGYTGGSIPLGPLSKTYDNNILLVGDAAAQVKPTSGGGIYPGLCCACHCAAVAQDAMENNIFTEKILKKYQKKWHEDIGKELYLGMKFRTIFTRLTDAQFDKYIAKFQQQSIAATISKHGDIDFPSKLIKPLLKKAPTLLTLLPKMLKE